VEIHKHEWKYLNNKGGNRVCEKFELCYVDLVVWSGLLPPTINDLILLVPILDGIDVGAKC